MLSLDPLNLYLCSWVFVLMHYSVRLVCERGRPAPAVPSPPWHWNLSLQTLHVFKRNSPLLFLFTLCLFDPHSVRRGVLISSISLLFRPLCLWPCSDRDLKWVSVNARSENTIQALSTSLDFNWNCEVVSTGMSYKEAAWIKVRLYISGASSGL